METQLSGTYAILIAGFLALIFITIGVVLFFVDRRQKRKAEASATWLETMGTVKESEVQQGTNVLMSNDEDGKGTPVKACTCSPGLVTRYQKRAPGYCGIE